LAIAEDNRTLLYLNSQWLFRSPQRVREAEVTVSELGLQAQLFTGLERQLIACVYNDFKSARMLGGYQILNWNHAYQTLMQALNNEAIQILCGLLPGKNSTNSLVNGFCQKAELQLKPDLIN